MNDVEEALKGLEKGLLPVFLKEKLQNGWKMEDIEKNGAILVISSLNERGQAIKMRYCMLKSSKTHETCWMESQRSSNAYQHCDAKSKHITNDQNYEESLLEAQAQSKCLDLIKSIRTTISNYQRINT